MKEGSLVDKIVKVLFAYCNTPRMTTGIAPAEILFGNRLRSHLDLIKPDPQARICQKQQIQKQHHDQHAKE